MRCDGGAHTGRMSPSTTPPHQRAALQLARIFTAGALVAGIALVASDRPAEAAGFAVTTTADGGAGSLRDAIDQANANPGPDTITVPAKASFESKVGELVNLPVRAWVNSGRVAFVFEAQETGA